MKNLLKITLILSIFLISCQKEEIVSDENYVDKELILKLVNDVRESGCNCGDEFMPPVDPVEWDDRLEEAARLNSAYLHYCYDETTDGANCFSHTWRDGTTVTDRYKMAGYKTWRGYGENISLGPRTEEQAIQSWLHSPCHCRNIMSKHHEKMGVAKNNRFWSMNFITDGE
jgi:uncharacterized protein YkwD